METEAAAEVGQAGRELVVSPAEMELAEAGMERQAQESPGRGCQEELYRSLCCVRRRTGLWSSRPGSTSGR